MNYCGSVQNVVTRSTKTTREEFPKRFTNSKQIIMDGRFQHVCSILAEFRNNGSFCDVEIQIQDKVFMAHKVILAACSQYFQAMFLGGMAEKHQSRICLHEICPLVFDKLIRFSYGFSLDLNSENVEDVLVAADMLQFSEATSICAEYLKEQLNPANAIGIYCFASGHALKRLTKSAWKFVLSNFSQVSPQEEFLSLPLEDLLRLVKSEYIAIEKELDVAHAIVRWISHDPQSRRKFCVSLFKHIRLGLISRPDAISIYECIDDFCLKIAVKLLVDDVHPENTANVSKLLSESICWQPRHSARKGFYAIGGSVTCRIRRRRWGTEELDQVSYMERYDSFAETWDAFPLSLREARSNLGACAVNGKIYAIGGEQDSMIYGSIECFDTMLKQWDWDMPLLSVPRCSFQVVAFGCCIYILGGYVGSGVGDSIECFDTELKICKVVNFSMQEARHSFGAVCLDGVIYMAGGIGNSECELNTVECYDLNRHEWWFANNMHCKRACFSLVTLKGLIYAVGGHSDVHGTLNSVEVFDPYDNTWKICCPMNQPRAGAFVAVMDNKIVVLGGKVRNKSWNEISSWTVINSAEMYDPGTDSWSVSDKMDFEARCDGASLVV